MTSASPVEESRGKAYVEGQQEAGLRQRSRMTHEESRGRLTLRVNGKLGLGCIDRGKKQDLATTKESRGKAYVVGQQEAGTRCIDLGWTVL